MKKVWITVDGEKQDFTVTGKDEDGILIIHQNESLFTGEFVEAVRKLGRWPKKDESLGENHLGNPCIVDSQGWPVSRRPTPARGLEGNK